MTSDDRKNTPRNPLGLPIGALHADSPPVQEFSPNPWAEQAEPVRTEAIEPTGKRAGEHKPILFD